MTTLGHILGKHRGYQKLLSDKRLLDRIHKNWEMIAGRLCHQLIPVSLYRGVLVLESENPVWKTELMFYEDTFLSKLEMVLKKRFVKKIKIQLRRSCQDDSQKSRKDSINRTFEEKIRDAVSEKVQKGCVLCSCCSVVYVEYGTECDFCRISAGR